MNFIETEIEGVVVVEMTPIRDDRGYFARSWCREEFAEAGLDVEWAQSNVGVSGSRHTLRGMHHQLAPHAEHKLVRCTMGSAFDVAVDLRPGSATYLAWYSIELSPDSLQALLIPPGCAHGYLTLEPSTHIEYLTSAPYAPEAATGVRYDDAAFGIDWPSEPAVISDQDSTWPDHPVSDD